MKVFLSPSTQPNNMCVLGHSEQDHCGALAGKLSAALASKGIEWRRRSGSITSGANAANSWHADLYLPMHTNASNGKVRGVRFGYYPGRADSKAKCLIFQKHMRTIYPIPGNVKVGTYSFLEARVPRMPSVYCELVFHDNVEDAQWFHANMDLIAMTLANAAAECGESEMIDPIPAPVPEPEKEPVKVDYQATVNTVGDPTLNLWIDTGKSKSLKLIPKSAVVQVIGEVSAKWAKITYAGLTGYCDRQYLVKVTDAPDAPNDPIDNTYLMPYIEAVESALNALKQAVRM